MRTDELLRDLFMAGFCGFFTALAIVGATTAAIARSAASAAYALLMLMMVGYELYGIPHGQYGGPALHATLLASYLICLVLFSLTLLRTMQYDRTVGNATLAVLGANLLLVFAQDLVPSRPPLLYALDQIALYALLAALAVTGVRALAREGPPLGAAYLIALVGPVLGLVVADVTQRAPAAAVQLSFDLGVVWQALFFAVAVALRNRGAQKERDRFERLAYVDGLTGIANRRTFDETLDRMWDMARRARIPIAVAMIDIDHFKRLNDTRGHQVGDECLRRVAALCSSVLRRAGDCFARYGGEEFAAILVNVDLDHAQWLSEHMRRTVENDGGITVSIGLAVRVPQGGDSPLALVADADHALYRAKHEGRNCVRVTAGEVGAFPP